MLNRPAQQPSTFSKLKSLFGALFSGRGTTDRATAEHDAYMNEYFNRVSAARLNDRLKAINFNPNKLSIDEEEEYEKYTDKVISMEIVTIPVILDNNTEITDLFALEAYWNQEGKKGLNPCTNEPYRTISVVYDLIPEIEKFVVKQEQKAIEAKRLRETEFARKEKELDEREAKLAQLEAELRELALKIAKEEARILANIPITYRVTSGFSLFGQHHLYRNKSDEEQKTSAPSCSSSSM